MGVDYLTCENCGNNFPDCGHFVTCENCGRDWCDYNCANADGYTEEYCKKGFEIEEQYCIDEDECTRGFKEGCFGCDNYIEESCSHCRGEEFEDCDLIETALKLLNIGREKLIEKHKKMIDKQK